MYLARRLLILSVFIVHPFLQVSGLQDAQKTYYSVSTAESLAAVFQADQNLNSSTEAYHEINVGENASSVSERKYEYLYRNLKRYFLKWYLPLVICLGTFGTAFCLIFLFLSRLFPPNMLIWLVSICVADFFVLVTEGIWMLLKVWFNYDIRDINDFTCVLHTSFSNYLLYWSAYMQCLLSMQRAYLIIRPLRARSSGPSMLCITIIWCAVSVLLVVPMLPYPLFWRVIDGDCDPLGDKLFYVTTLSDFIIWGLIPLIGMTSATVIICWSIFRIGKSFKEVKAPGNPVRYSVPSSTLTINQPTMFGVDTRSSPLAGTRFSVFRFRRSFAQTQRVDPTNPIAIGTTVHLDVPLYRRGHSIDSPNPFIRQATNSGERQGQRHGTTDNAGHVARLLICMNVLYMFSTYPLMIYLMSLNFVLSNVDRDVHKFMYYLSRSLCFLNACSNWIFYCASGRLFRQRTKQIFSRLISRIRIHSNSHSSILPDHFCTHTPVFHHSCYSQLRTDRTRLLRSGHFRNTVVRTNLYNPSALGTHVNCTQPTKTKSPLAAKLTNRRERCLACSSCVFPSFFSFQCQCTCCATDPLSDKGQFKCSLLRGKTTGENKTSFWKRIKCCHFWCIGLPPVCASLEKTTGPLTPSGSSSLHFHSELWGTPSNSRYRRTVGRCADGPMGNKRENHSANETNLGWPVEPHSQNDCGQPSGQQPEKEHSKPEAEHSKHCSSAPGTLFGIGMRRSETSMSENALKVPFPNSTGLSTNCYCYISSHGNRRYHYHYCRLHQNAHRSSPKILQRAMFDLPEDNALFGVNSVDKIDYVSNFDDRTFSGFVYPSRQPIPYCASHPRFFYRARLCK